MEKTKKTCVFDMDCVIAGTHYALENKIKQKYPKFSLNNVHTYNFNKELGTCFCCKNLIPFSERNLLISFSNEEAFVLHIGHPFPRK